MNAGASVGARSRAMLSLVSAFGAKSFQSKSFQSKGFRLPSAAESLSLCVAKEKVTQEKGHPDGAPCGHPALRVRGWATGFFDSTSCAGEKLAGIPAGHPAGFPSPTRRAIGAPGRAARSQRALFKGARSRAEAKPKQSVALLWLSLFAFRLSTECGPGWPAALPGVPCAAVSRGRQAAQRASTGMSMPFRQGRMPCRKARPRLTDLPGRSPASAKWGAPLFGYFLSGNREKVTRPPKEDESSLALASKNTAAKAIVSERKARPTMLTARPWRPPRTR